jgi:hypothetical protein
MLLQKIYLDLFKPTHQEISDVSINNDFFFLNLKE